MAEERKKIDKYVKMATNAKSDEAKLIGDQVQRGELKWAYYASDGNIGYIYYLIIK